MRQNPIPSVRAIIKNVNGEVLILKRAAHGNYGNVWCLPGGKIDFVRSAEATVMKEVKEETNLNCTEVKFLFYLDGLPSQRYNTHYPTLYFKCKAEGQVKLNDESVEFAWVDKSNLQKYDIIFENDIAIERYVV